MSQIVIISGASASGKTTLAHTLAPMLGASVINAGDIVLATLTANGFAPCSRADAGRIFLDAFGEDALGPLLERRAMHFERLIIDGLRLPSAYDLLSDRAASTFHIHLEASLDVRRERLLLREGHDNTDNIADSYAPRMKRCADLVVENEQAGAWQLVGYTHDIRNSCITPGKRSFPVYPGQQAGCGWSTPSEIRLKERGVLGDFYRMCQRGRSKGLVTSGRQACSVPFARTVSPPVARWPA